ncbi:MAG: hypothetical protein L3J06_09480 [Cyclobacteriaceae bacterium]|nr:hypothetical protein [Cyclobacteriaceae bacterium]
MLNELLALNPSLWVQVGGMSSAISLGVFLFSMHQTIHSNQGIALILVLELLIILFSVATFSVYLTKKGFGNAEKIGLRKILGTSGFQLFIEVAVRTTLLITLSILISIGIMDVSTRLVGLFEYMLQSIGVLQFGILLLIVFLILEGALFIIIGVALAPNLKQNINEITKFDKYWFTKLGGLLLKSSLLLVVIIAVLLSVFTIGFVKLTALKLLILIFYTLLVLWYLHNRRPL